MHDLMSKGTLIWWQQAQPPYVLFSEHGSDSPQRVILSDTDAARFINISHFSPVSVCPPHLASFSKRVTWAPFLHMTAKAFASIKRYVFYRCPPSYSSALTSLLDGSVAWKHLQLAGRASCMPRTQCGFIRRQSLFPHISRSRLPLCVHMRKAHASWRGDTHSREYSSANSQPLVEPDTFESNACTRNKKIMQIFARKICKINVFLNVATHIPQEHTPRLASGECTLPRGP